MTDGELRALADSFFDALEQNDIETVRWIYAPTMRFWINLTGEEKSGEQSIETLIAGKERARRRTYNDRQYATFKGGFLARYTINIVLHDGKTKALSACIVVRCNAHGQFTRIDEYLDSGRMSPRADKAA